MATSLLKMAFTKCVLVLLLAIQMCQSTKTPWPEGLCVNIPTNLSRVPPNMGNIPLNQGNMTLNMGNITTNQGIVTSNIGNITNNEGNMSGNLGNVINNNCNIATNLGNITTNLNNVTGNMGNIITNLGNISTNMGKITTNKGNITNNINNITINTGNIGSSLGNIDTNIGNITINFGTITNNFGHVKTNLGTIVNDLGHITANLSPHQRKIDRVSNAKKSQPNDEKSNSSMPSIALGQDSKQINRNTHNATSTSTAVSHPAVTVNRNNAQILNLSGHSYNGYDVKTVLNQFNDSALDNIRVLYLSHNNITDMANFTFPVNFEYGLHELHLDHNRLSFTARTMFELSRLQNLKVLNLSKIQWSNDDLGSLFLPNLRLLDLSFNRLIYLPTLDGLLRLQTLDLTGNAVYNLLLAIRIPKTLTTLNLAHNQISWFPDQDVDKFWTNPIHLSKLDLSYNSLKDPLHVDQLDVKSIDVRGNPWVCSCDLVPTLSHSNIRDKTQVTCTLDGVEYRWPMTNLPAQFQDKWYLKTIRWYRQLQKNKRMYEKVWAYINVLLFLALLFLAWLLWRHLHPRKASGTHPTPSKLRGKTVFSAEVPYTVL